MTEPIWISVEEAVAINKQLVAQFGGLDAGVRDKDLLHAALARPLNKWHYDSPRADIHALAAAYAFGIAKGHVFHDGNKRTAYTVAVTFLDVNSLICVPDKADAVETMVSLAEGSISEREMAEWFAGTTRPARGLSEDPQVTTDWDYQEKNKATIRAKPAQAAKKSQGIPPKRSKGNRKRRRSA